MIIVGEVREQGMNHVPINAALLKMIKMIFPNQQIYFFGERECISHLKNWDDQLADIKFIDIFFIKHGKLTFLFREILMFFHIFYLHCLCKQKKSRLLFFLSMSPFSQYLLEFFKPIFFAKVNTLVILHELDWLTAKRFSSKSIRGFFMSKAIKFNNRKNLKYLLLGEMIKQNLIDIDPEIKQDDFFWIDHPYTYELIQDKKDRISECVKFASIGTADVTRHVQKIFEIAFDFSEQISLKKMEFEIIGQIQPNMYEFVNDKVVYSSKTDKLPRNIYEKKIQEMDYALFFRTDNGSQNSLNYSLRASGALFDAIQFEKPIIVIRNAYFEYYFRRFGNIGYLCNDISEMKEVIQYIVSQRPETDYEIQVTNLKKAKEQLSIDNIQLFLEKQLESWVV